MADKPQPWPYHAANARDCAAEEAAASLRMLTPLLGEMPLSEVEKIRRVALAVQHLQTALRHLEKAGAKTTP